MDRHVKATRGDVASLTLPDSSVESWTYDGTGNTTAYTNPLSQTISYTYDNAGRQTGVDYPTGTDTSFGYDDDDRTSSMVDATGTTSWTYNAADELTEVILSTWDSDSDTRSISRGLAMTGFEHRIESGLCILSIDVFQAMLEREYFSGYDAVWFISEGKVPSEPPPDSLQHVIESLTLSGLKRLKTVAEWMSKHGGHLSLIRSDGTIIVSALDASENESLMNGFHLVDVGGI